VPRVQRKTLYSEGHSKGGDANKTGPARSNSRGRPQLMVFRAKDSGRAREKRFRARHGRGDIPFAPSGPTGGVRYVSFGKAGHHGDKNSLCTEGTKTVAAYTPVPVSAVPQGVAGPFRAAGPNGRIPHNVFFD